MEQQLQHKKRISIKSIALVSYGTECETLNHVDVFSTHLKKRSEAVITLLFHAQNLRSSI